MRILTEQSVQRRIRPIILEGANVKILVKGKCASPNNVLTREGRYIKNKNLITHEGDT